MAYCNTCKKENNGVLLPDGRRCAECKRKMDNSTDKYCEKCAKEKSVCQFCGAGIKKKGFFNGAGFGFA